MWLLIGLALFLHPRCFCLALILVLSLALPRTRVITMTFYLQWDITITYIVKKNTNLCNVCITDSAVVESSPVVGSSRNNTAGDTTISMAMLHRFLCPPDTPRVNGVPI